MDNATHRWNAVDPCIAHFCGDNGQLVLVLRLVGLVKERREGRAVHVGAWVLLPELFQRALGASRSRVVAGPIGNHADTVGE